MKNQTGYVSLESCCSHLKFTNPALLGTLAEQLRSISDQMSEFYPDTIYVSGISDPKTRHPITYFDVSAYLRKATGKFVPVLFETPFEVVESHTVMVSRDWLSGRIEAAKERIGKIHTAEAETVRSSQILKMANASFHSFFEDQPAPLDSLGHQELQKKLAIQSDQRKAQEAASKDAIVRRHAEERLAVAEALLAEARAKEKVLSDENRSFYNELTAKDRKIQDRDLEIESLRERLTVFAACFNPHSPLHPASLNEALECWIALTRNGTYNPSGPGGRGALILVLNWLSERGEKEVGTPKKPSAKALRLSVIIGWRKAGSGAIRSK
ncbi:hypothetical protein [Pseudomonas sp. UMAB-08]|uniref:hypothetical protein n=1 Tax=Pseudomonas sp. UMAB-08 TaxID=1365375 RepID=UPI001C5917C3|nr:hypothetical protein [Pseudomonas sp. UMAB-08]